MVETLDDSEEGLIRDLGTATARFLEMSLTGGDVVGLSSWSATLLGAVRAMRPLGPRAGAERALQLLGGVGNPDAEAQAAQLTQRFADLTGAQAKFLLAPGIAASVEARDVLAGERFMRQALDDFATVTLALVGIGALHPSPLLQSSGNFLADDELADLRSRGAVGDVCLRFFDADGDHIASDVDRRVIGVSAEQLRAVDRSVGVAGGERKFEAIRGAIRGGWINVLITDRATAERLLD